MPVILGAAAAIVFSRSVAEASPVFTDVTPQSGIDFLHAGFLGAYRLPLLVLLTPNPLGLNYVAPRMPEAMGSGVCWIDYDGDGWQDLYFVNGRYLSQPEKERDGKPRNRLYRNRGDANQDGIWDGFEEVTAAAGVGDEGVGQGCVVGDYDNDGDSDLYVLNYGHPNYPGPNLLYRNNGDGTFTDVAEAAGVADPFHWGASGTFFDYDRDGDLDLYVSNYASYDVTSSDPGGNGPVSLPGDPNVLYRNDGGGTFTEVTAVAGVAGLVDRDGNGDVEIYNPGHTWLAVAGDYDNDGWPDLFVLNDEDPKNLYRNRGDGAFTDVAAAACVSDNRNDPAASGCLTGNVRSGDPGRGSMGSDFGDLDGNGFLDTASVHYFDECAALYMNRDGSVFDDVGGHGEALSETCSLVGWGTLFFDYDNDADLDVLIANSDTELGAARIHGRGNQVGMPTLLYRNDSSGALLEFREVGAQAGSAFRRNVVGRGAAYADFDRDGDLDVVLSMGGEERPLLLRNDGGNSGGFVRVELAGVASNREGIGARVTVEAGGRIQFRELLAGSSHMSTNELALHFGLGGAATVDSLSIRWPSGVVQTYHDLAARVAARIGEAEGEFGCAGKAEDCPHIEKLW